MTTLLRRELGIRTDSDRVIKLNEIDQSLTFEQQVELKFKPYIGRKITAIAEELGVDLTNKSKSKYATLARAIMGVKSKRIEEFDAAGVVMKTIQLRADGTPKEHMSFPSFKYTELVTEIWDGDEEEGENRALVQDQFERRFFFVVYRCSGKCKPEDERVLEKAFFWSMPTEDLEEVRRVWEETKTRINKGEAEKLPGSKWSPVTHVRPHAKNKADGFLTPQGKMVTKKCFWLNKEYLANYTK